MAERFIKLYSKMRDWEWYKDTNTFCLFIHCLLMANWKDGRFMGELIPRGSFASSYPQLAQQTGMSVQNVRTAVNHLKFTGELTVKSQAKFSVFTVVKYNDYQDVNSLLTGDQQAPNSQLTTIVDKVEEIEDIESIKDISIKDINKKHIYGEYKHVRLTDKERDRLFNDYGETETLEAIKYLDEYIQEKPRYKSKDHNLAMRRWVFDAVREQKAKRGHKVEQPKEKSLAEKWGLSNDG